MRTRIRSGGGRALALLVMLLALGGMPSRTLAGRVEMDLSGTWQYQNVSQLSFPPSNNWQTITIPGFLSGWDYEHAWFRCVFTPPAPMAGTELKLRFGGAKFNSQVWLNGTFIGSYLNGYEPFEFDITGTAAVGQTNELIVGVTDWTATFQTNVDFTNLPANEDPRYYVVNDILAPIGGRYNLYGLWQPVTLVSVPPVSIDDVFVMSSVRTQQLTVRLTLRNDAGAAQTVSVTNRVLDGANTALSLPAQRITVPPGLTSVDISAAWTNAHWWSHLDPYLYSLQTTVAVGAAQDQLATVFGFREFWAQNGQFLLNGIPINLHATATWPPLDLQTSNTMAKTLLDVKAGNNVAMRMHTQPWDEPWYEVADRIGLLIVEECAVWCDPTAYRLSDPGFWANYSQHLAAAVKRDRNHPAIVLWSLENEILHCGGGQIFSGTEEQLAAMGALVKGIDPTRPITYEADLDPDGEADALGLHYPHEYPDYQLWPNAAWWMNQSIARYWVPGGQWTWDHTKPLYIGEFLFVPPTLPAGLTILCGDDGYANPTAYRDLAKGLTWRMQIEAYRAYGVNGVSPWTMFEDPAFAWGTNGLNAATNYLYQVQAAAYQPNYVFVEEYTPRCFCGDTVTRTAHVFNDTPVTNSLSLSWSVGGAWQRQGFVLPPAGQWSNSIAFTAPATPGAFNFQCQVSAGANVLSTNTYNYAAYSRPTLVLPGGAKFALYDPFGTTSNLFGRFNIPFTAVTNLRTAAYNRFSLLVLGAGALTNEPLPEVGPGSLAAQLHNYVSSGGWVLALEQTNYPAWMPLQIQSFDATFAFPSPVHPAMQGLTTNDLRWWAGDHRVVANALVAPATGNFRILASIGSTSGLEYAAAVEVPVGSGGFLCSQFLLAQKFDVEPLAGSVLQRLLSYCAPGAGTAPCRPAGIVAETNSPGATLLAGLGLQAENLSGRLTNCDPVLYPVMVLAGTNACWQEATAQLSNLTAYVQAGGRLVLHRPTSAFLAAAQPALFPGLVPSDLVLGQVLRRDATNGVARFYSHDFYWISQPGNWNQADVISTNIARRTYREQFNLTNYSTLQVAAMPIHSTGAAASGGWWLYGNGYVAQNISIAQAGTYLFNISASGTPAFGGWPQMSLQIDGQVLDSTFVPSETLAFYTLSADLTAGTHQLAITYDNDAWNPPTEDRNLFLEQVEWGRCLDNDPVTPLTQPSAVVQYRLGSGLVVLDEIMWESETQNATKAARYACTLLTGLGVALSVPAGVAIQATTMSNVNVSAYSIAGNVAWVNSNGYIQAPAHFTTTGYYTFSITAGGTAAAGGLPEIGLVLDGVNRAYFVETTTNMAQYGVTLWVTAGTHNVGLAFLNDYYANGQDRNAAFELLTMTPETAPRITALETDGARQTAILQWEATPGKRYEVQTASGLSTDAWRNVTNFIANGTVVSWWDVGDLTNAPPLGAAAPQRFYRVLQLGP